MSKYVKDLMTNDLKQKLEGVSDALLVNVVGMDANSNNVLRKRLNEKDIRLMVVKNSTARRATEGTPLAPAFEGAEGTLALVWGCEDLISLAKEVTRLADDKQFPEFEPRGGVMDGSQLSSDQVKEISKWPSRPEQLSILMGQILSPGSTLSAQLLAPGAKLASQLKQKGSEEEEAE